MREYTREFFAWDDFVGRSFKINEVFYDQWIHNNAVRESRCFDSNYVTFVKKKTDGIYIGELYAVTYKGKFILKALNPVQIEICSAVINNSIELSITKDGDGLLLDSKHNNIMNTLDNDTATDIFSYLMNVKEEA